MYSIIATFQKQVERCRDKRLFAFLDVNGNIKESYTYSAFNDRTKCIAAYLSNYNLLPGERVLLAYNPGIEMIATFFACVRLGVIPVPVYPPSANGLEASVKKMHFIATDCGAAAILTDRSCYWSFKINGVRKGSEITNLQWIVTEDADETILSERIEQPGHILFLQYTSGSTSEPKGVMVTHENIMRNCDNVVDHVPVGVSWLPQYHDMGLIGYYLFFALKGGTTYGFSPTDFIQRPSLWFESIMKFGATASSAPNFAYEYCLQPSKIPAELLDSLDLSTLRFLMNAAEPIRAQTFQAFFKKFSSFGLRRESFFGAYGLAEYTLAVTNYGTRSIGFDENSIRQKRVKVLPHSSDYIDNRELVSCGKVLQDTEVCIVDELSLKPAEANCIGEIWIRGSSKCIGYWNRSELSEEIFNARLDGQVSGWLRTGDLGFIYEDELYVCGRIKDLIIIHGVNYYPQDFEAIVEENSFIRKGCSVAFLCEEEDALVIVAGVKNPTMLPSAHEIEKSINKYSGVKIHEIVFVPARTIPKTSSGKLRRFKCREDYKQNELQVVSRSLISQHGVSNYPSNAQKLTGDEDNLNLNYLFSRYQLSANGSVLLGHAGLDSLKIAEFGHDLKIFLKDKAFDDLSEEVDLKLLQRVPVSELFSILQEVESGSLYTRFRFRQAFQKISKEFEESERELMVKDASIEFNFSHDTQNCIDDSAGDIFLTGGTGFFGAFLINSILEQNDQQKIYVLVRASSVEEGYERLRKAFATINPSLHTISLFSQRVKVLCGDLARTQLGLQDFEWTFLSKQINCIYHNGAYVNYLKDYETMRSENVMGTREVIRLSMNGKKKTLNHISTTFIFGWSAKDTLFESDSNTVMEHLDFGYSQSKWVCDQLVRNAMSAGLSARIFRPALISPSVSGNGYNFDISIRLLSFMVKHGISTSALNQVSFTPADIAANNIVAISNIPSSTGKTFHVTRDEYSSMKDVTDIFRKLTGKSFEHFTLKHFVPQVISRCTKSDLLFPLLNFLVRSVDNISTMEFKRYDNGNYRSFRQMSPWGKVDPALDEVVSGIFIFMNKNHLISDVEGKNLEQRNASEPHKHSKADKINR